MQVYFQVLKVSLSVCCIVSLHNIPGVCNFWNSRSNTPVWGKYHTCIQKNKLLLQGIAIKISNFKVGKGWEKKKHKREEKGMAKGAENTFSWPRN